MNAKIIIRNYVKGDGTSPLLLYVLIENKKVRIPIGVDVNAKDFDAEKQIVKKSAKDAKHKNLIIGNALGRASELMKEYALMGINPTAKDFERDYSTDADRRDFIPFFESEVNIDYQKGNIGISTLKVYKLAVNRLKEYMKVKHKQNTLTYSQMSHDLFTDFDIWHANIHKSQGTRGTASRSKIMKCIKKYVSRARERGIKVPDVLKYVNVRNVSMPRTFLTEEEVRTMMAYFDQIEGETHHKKVLRGFLFQCFTGLRFSDLCALRRKNIEGNLLVFVPQKTKEVKGEQLRIPLSVPAKKLLVAGESPIPTCAEQVTNRTLKKLANDCNIEKVLTTHVGRHTFATMSVDRGVKVNVLQQLMGHSSIETTMIYVHLVDKKPMQDISAAFDDF
jgi:integrase/recombinase XerD